MSYTSLELFRQQARIDDFEGDEVLVQSCLDAAEEWVFRAVNRDADELLEMGGGESLPAPITRAIVLLAATWYNQREAETSLQSNAVRVGGLEPLLRSYRKLGTS